MGKCELQHVNIYSDHKFYEGRGTRRDKRGTETKAEEMGRELCDLDVWLHVRLSVCLLVYLSLCGRQSLWLKAKGL